MRIRPPVASKPSTPCPKGPQRGATARFDYLSAEIESTEEATASANRLNDTGPATFQENDTSSCYALLNSERAAACRRAPP
ncbi:hypothetical protein [Streptomyces cyaneofuscatus]|uniref:hypothetical protein n=1 Tax=Streptomyces cyaneofuscatus TaxID=66883 RepID=UPI0036558692